MKKKELPDVRAQIEREIRADLERERDAIAKPIMAGMMRWIQTAAWWKLVLAYIATWPIGVLEAAIMHEIIGLFPGVGTVIDGMILHAINEFIFLTLPILLLLELWRRSFWKVHGWATVVRGWFGPRIGQRNGHDVIDADDT